MLKEFFEKLTFKPDPVRLYSSGISDVGQRRKLNEDNYLIDEKLGLFIVADGMGGHDAGEVASKLAIETIFNYIKQLHETPKDSQTSQGNDFNHVLQGAIEEANNQTHCYNVAKGLPEGKGMGTTVTGLWIGPAGDRGGKQIHTFNVGDSRTYRYNQGKLTQLSTDHSHYQLWLDTGKDGPAPRHNIIYKAVGPWRRVVAEQRIFPIQNNDIFLLCSDGLCDMITDNEIRDILHRHRKEPLDAMTQALIAAANKAGGKDNVTVVLIRP